MNSKRKVRIYKKVNEEGCRECNGTKEFIVNKAKGLCLQEGISTEEVSKAWNLLRFVIFICMLCYVHSLEWVYFHYFFSTSLVFIEFKFTQDFNVQIKEN